MKRVLFGLFIIVGTLMIINNDALGQTAGVVTVDSISAHQGEQIAVPVHLSGNSYNIASLLVPIKYSQDNLLFDSVSFTGSFIASNYTAYYTTDLIPGAVSISYIWTDYTNSTPMYSPNGLIGTIFFTVNGSTAPGNYPLDSVNIIQDLGVGIVEYNVQMADPSGMQTYYPDYIKGDVAVLVPTGIEDDINTGLPTSFSLAQNYPNPFNPTTTIEFSLPTNGYIKLDIFNVLGQKVATLADGIYQAGVHSVEFNAIDHPSGVFFYRLTYPKGVETKKMLLLK